MFPTIRATKNKKNWTFKFALEFVDQTQCAKISSFGQLFAAHGNGQSLATFRNG